MREISRHKQILLSLGLLAGGVAITFGGIAYAATGDEPSYIQVVDEASDSEGGTADGAPREQAADGSGESGSSGYAADGDARGDCPDKGGSGAAGGSEGAAPEESEQAQQAARAGRL